MMKTRVWRLAVAAAAGSAVLVAAAPGAFGALEIFTQFAENELPSHMMSMDMMGIDMWMVMTPMSMMFIPGDYDQITIFTQLSGRQRILVDGPCDVLFSGMLMAGIPDEWVNSQATLMFLGIGGMAPMSPTTAQCRYAINGEAIAWEVSGFTSRSPDPWSFTGVALTLDISGLGGRVPKEYSLTGLSFALVEEVDSGQAFSRIVPEPAGLALAVLGGLGLLLRRWRK